VIDYKVEDVDFLTIQAVKDKRVYNTALGMWNWFTSNSDATLVLAWLAYNTYPEEFSVILCKHVYVIILGPNGGGKTALLKCMVGLLDWEDGTSFL
jgi:ABC-type transport system involved in cytochrome bd biosynthesis fused ATPase/permease subunit